MVNKALSIGTLLGLVSILLMSNTAPSDPLFALVSEEYATWVIRLAIVASMIGLTFRNYLRRAFTRKLTLFAGMTLAVSSLTAIILPSAGAAVAEYFKLLDLLIVLQAGVVFSSVALNKQIEPEYGETKATIPVRVRSTAPAKA